LRYKVHPDSRFIKTGAVLIKVVAFPLALLVYAVAIPAHLVLTYLFRGYCPRCRKRSLYGIKVKEPGSLSMYDGGFCSACKSSFRFQDGRWEYVDKVE
jgi:hypothetical protein